MARDDARRTGEAGRTGDAALGVGWSRLHHGIDPTAVPLLRGWLRVVWALGRPLARWGVRPMTITLLGALLALAAAAVAYWLPWLAAALVLASVLCDGLDGAVALLIGRAGAAGARADRLADRVADLAFAVVLAGCGAPWWLAVAAGASALALEGLRRGMAGAALAAITVGERPSRTICALIACCCAGMSSAVWPATVCAAVWVALSLIGLGQLCALRHR